MKKIDQVEIKGFEQTGPATLQVVMEAPKECFDRNYPVRLRHSFSMDKKLFYENSNGNLMMFEKLKDIYLDSRASVVFLEEASKNVDEVADRSVSEWVDYLNSNFTGFVID